MDNKPELVLPEATYLIFFQDPSLYFVIFLVCGGRVVQWLVSGGGGVGVSFMILLCFCFSEAHLNVRNKVSIKLPEEKWDLGRNLSKILEQSPN